MEIQRLALGWNFTTDRFNYAPPAEELNYLVSATVCACRNSTLRIRRYAGVTPLISPEASSLLCEMLTWLFLRSFISFRRVLMLTFYFKYTQISNYHITEKHSFVLHVVLYFRESLGDWLNLSPCKCKFHCIANVFTWRCVMWLRIISQSHSTIHSV